MNKLLKPYKDQLEKQDFPEWVSPTLAKLTDDHFSDPDWIYERKFDGVRCLIFKQGNEVRLLSRNKKSQNDIYPELKEAFDKIEKSFVADGEIVTFADDVTSFSKLQDRINNSNPSEDLIKEIPVYFYLFDIMYLEGYSTEKLSLRDRKSILKEALQFEDPLRYCPHKNEQGIKYYKDACKRGWEGLIAKDATAQYIHSRTSKWLKFKCVHQQELVIGGFTEPEGERKGFGAILVGFYEGETFHYAGKVGTGWSDDELVKLRDKFEDKARKTSPFQEEIDEEDVHFLTPHFVAEIGFTEWTDDNKLRHPRYIGMRHDKDAKDVVKER